MGILRGLVGLGVAAGAAFAAVKVAQKYDENKAAEAELYDEAPEQETEVEVTLETAQEPEAAQPQQDTTASGVLNDLGRAVNDVLMEAGAKIKAAAQKAGVDTDELKDALQGAGAAVAHAGGAVVDYVRQETPGVVENVREGAKDVLSHVKDAVSVSMGTDEDWDEDDAVDADSAADTWNVIYNTQDAADAADAAQDAADVAQERADALQAAAEAAQQAADAAPDDEDLQAAADAAQAAADAAQNAADAAQDAADAAQDAADAAQDAADAFDDDDDDEE